MAAARELHTCGVKGQRRDRARVAVKGEARRGALGVPEAHGAVGVADGVYVCVGRTGNGCHGAAVANLVPHGTLCEWLQGGARTCSAALYVPHQDILERGEHGCLAVGL